MQKQTAPATGVSLWTKNFMAITIANMFMFLNFQMFPAALPVYAKSLGATDHVVGWLGGMLIIATLITRPIAGLALDRIGRKSIYFTGLIIVFVMTIAYGLFPIVAVIMVVRFLHGLGWGFANTSATTIAADIIPKARFAEGMAYFSLFASLAMAFAPALALYVGMRLTVILGAFFMLVVMALALTVKYRTFEPRPKNAPRQKMSPYEKTAIWPGCVMFMITCCYGATVTFVAIYAHSMDIAGIGVFFTVYALSLIITRPYVGKLIDKKGFGSALVPGTLACVASMVVLGFAENLTMFLISAALFGFGYGCCQTSLLSMAMLKAPANRTGAANATFFTGFDAGMGFGSILAGFLATHFSYGEMYLIIAVLPLAAFCMYLLTTGKITKKLGRD